MKIYSIYNSVVSLTDKYSLMYNSYADTYLIINSSVKELIKVSTSEVLSKIEPQIYSDMVEGKFIIDADIDERKELMIKINEMNNNDLHYQITVNPTMDCNCRCWYCYENHESGSRMEKQTLEKVKKLIDNIVVKKKELIYFNLSFFGGEPLIHFFQSVEPLLEHFNIRCKGHNISKSISFTTNGYAINPKMVKSFVKNEVNSFQITLDGHREEHNKVRFVGTNTGTYDRILKNVKQLITNKMYVLLRINYTGKNIDTVKNIYKDLSEIPESDRKYLDINFQRVWQDEWEKDEYIEDATDQSVSYFKEKGIRVSRRAPNYLQSSCYADKRNQVLINYNGDVYKCTARDFKTQKRDGYLTDQGVVVWENDALERRMNSILRNKVCKDCRIAPLCGGNCAQRSMENLNASVCYMQYNDKEKDNLVVSRFYDRFVDIPNQIKNS